jgi:exodeoxyribonuclease V alpha subunit
MAKKTTMMELLAKIGVAAQSSNFLPLEHIHFQLSVEEQEKALYIPDPLPQVSFSLTIKLNEKQMMAAEYAENRKSFVLTGAAGTGKTTALREIARTLVESNKLGTHDFKSGPGPSIAFCAFTHVACGNIRKAIFKDPHLHAKLQNNVLTIHKLLEFEPEFYTVEDPKTGELRNTMRFIPRRNASNPLHLTHLIIEEASMVDANGIWMKLFDALLPGCQIIFVGDINQLQPIFGPSVLNHALINLPVVELTDVYRQALDSRIIYNAHRVLRGETLESDATEVKLIQTPSGGKLLTEHKICLGFINSLEKEWKQGIYDPDTNIILSPFNKNELGTINLNKHIAQFIGDKRKAEVYEIFAGMNRWYLAIGDKVLVHKMDGVIKSIRHNGRYFGKIPRGPSYNLTRHGQYIPRGAPINDKDLEGDEEDFELSYQNVNVEDVSDKEKKNEASHIVVVELEDGEEITLSQVGDFNQQIFSLGYALTVHKAQGREWARVYIMIHKNQATLLSRELIYTALTRASKEVIINDQTNYLTKALKTQRVKGNTTLEKIEWFNSKISLEVPIPLIP